MVELVHLRRIGEIDEKNRTEKIAV